mgnify:CR=1 FL=1
MAVVTGMLMLTVAGAADISIARPSVPAQTESREPGKESISSDLPAYPSEDAGSVMYQSSLGYSCKYDPTVFTLLHYSVSVERAKR